MFRDARGSRCVDRPHKLRTEAPGQDDWTGTRQPRPLLYVGRMRRGRAMTLLMSVFLVLPGCSLSDGGDASGPSGSDQKSAGVSVEVPEGAFDDAIKVEVKARTAPKDSGDFLVGPVVEISARGGAQPLKPVTIRFPPAPKDERLTIAYLDPDSGWWFPVDTRTDPATGEQLATVDHLSLWGRFRNKAIDPISRAAGGLQGTASWVEYQGFRLFGNRATRPRCEGKLPPWVAGDLIVNPDDNAELFACAQSQGDDVLLKLVNNRGYPVTVEFSRPFASSSLSLPGTLGDLVQQISNPGTSTRLFLIGTGSGTVRFSRPTRPANGVVEGHARRDGGTMLANVAFDLLSLGGADLPVGGGKTLGLSTIECVSSQAGTVAGTAEAIRTTDSGRAAGAVGGLRDCVRDVVDTELARAVPQSDNAKNLGRASKFLTALAFWDLTQQAADAFINDSTAEAQLVDVSFRWKLPLTAETIDLRNATLPARSCAFGAWGNPEPIPLVNGTGRSGDRSKDPSPGSTYNYAEAFLVDDPLYADVDRDGNIDAVVMVGCSAGGASTDRLVLALTVRDSQLVLIGGHNLGPVAGDATHSSRIFEMALDGVDIVVGEHYNLGGEPRCCYSGRASVRWRWNGKEWAPTISGTRTTTSVTTTTTIARSTGTRPACVVVGRTARYAMAPTVGSVSCELATSVWRAYENAGGPGTQSLNVLRGWGCFPRSDKPGVIASCVSDSDGLSFDASVAP